MTDDPRPTRARADALPGAELGRKAARKIRARADAAQGVWFGFGMMGLIGWSVVLPTLLGAAIGGWLDGHGAGHHRWTLALLVAGLVIGCANAWYWVANEDRAITEAQDPPDA
jgi:ATP synthase protein I